jgi:putative peptide zinc metalloprotease protein
LLLSLMSWAEVTSYGDYVLREHFLAVFAAGTLVVFSHEFAHGLTCKAFGGRTTEVGLLMIYYFLPALYCNVSGVHLIPQRNRRLWVIAAGVYWQLLVGITALLAWFVFEPYTIAADLAFIFFMGSVVDIIFNANPLIKLDGYYFLSQILRMPNLMDRSRAYWRGLLSRMLSGERDNDLLRHSRRERAIYVIFGALSFFYTLALIFIILRFVGEYLVNSFQLAGLLLTFAIAIFFMRRPLRRTGFAVASIFVRQLGTHFSGTARRIELFFRPKSEAVMKTEDQAVFTSASAEASEKRKRRWRRRLVLVTIPAFAIAVMFMPWAASVGSYGTITAMPGQEAIIRAPEGSTLIELLVRPGDTVTSGAVVGRMGNVELEEQILQVQSELVRSYGDRDRLLDGLRVQRESIARAETQLVQRQRDYDDLSFEQRQIDERRIEESSAEAPRLIPASTSYRSRAAGTAGVYPAAIAALQSEVDLERVQAEEAHAQLERERKLYAQGITARRDLDLAETRYSTLKIETTAARNRLEAALIEHSRTHASRATEMNVARSDVNAERLQVEKLNRELSDVSNLIRTLEERRDLLRRKQAGLELLTPRAGTVFGEDAPRKVGQFFPKGAEIFRVAETGRMLVRIQVSEKEIGDARMGQPVRLKTRAFPDKTFHGVVSKIGGESEPDEHGQPTYRVELTVENREGRLRPGMTAFARIEYDRRTIGWILLHTIRQALRPELWMF